MSSIDWPTGFEFVPPFPVHSGELSDAFPRDLQILVAWGMVGFYDYLAAQNRRIADVKLNDPLATLSGDDVKPYQAPAQFAEQQKKLARRHLERLYRLPSGEVVALVGRERLFVDYDRSRFVWERCAVDIRGRVKKGLPLRPTGARIVTALARHAGIGQHEDDLWDYMERLRGVRDADRPGKFSNHIDHLREAFRTQTEPEIKNHEYDGKVFNRVFESVGRRVWRLNLDPAEVRFVSPMLFPLSPPSKKEM